MPLGGPEPPVPPAVWVPQLIAELDYVASGYVEEDYVEQSSTAWTPQHL